MGRRQQPGEARTARAGFAEVVLVCRKCAKRQGVDRARLGRALKRAAGREAGGEGGRKGSRKVKVVATGCLGPCPKRMLTVATPASLARARVILLDPALDALGPETLRLDASAQSPALPSDA